MNQDRPNILLILTDQNRWDTINAHVNSFHAQTPAMDGLVERGVTFENAFCTAPVCCPSRAAIQTGLYPTASQVPSNLSPPLNDGFNTIGNRMQAAGYQTVYFGKSHLKGDLKAYGYEIAFENSHDFTTMLEAAKYWRNKDWIRGKRPFFGIVSYINPHDIYFLDADQEDEADQDPWPSLADDLKDKPLPQQKRATGWSNERWQYYRNFYGQLLGEVDTVIGQALEQLLRSGYLYNTWLIFTADHGDMAGEHGIPFKGPYMYDGVIRVPLVIVPPSQDLTPARKGHVNKRTENFKPFTSPVLTSNIDLVPTIMDIAGLPADPSLPGRSLLPVIKKEKFDEPEAVYAEWNDARTPIRMVRTHDWKYVLYRDHGEELYDLNTDPHEITNLAASREYTSIKKQHQDMLTGFLQKEKDPFLEGKKV